MAAFELDEVVCRRSVADELHGLRSKKLKYNCSKLKAPDFCHSLLQRHFGRRRRSAWNNIDLDQACSFSHYFPRSSSRLLILALLSPRLTIAGRSYAGARFQA